MFIKAGNKIINMDLIKEIRPTIDCKDSIGGVEFICQDGDTIFAFDTSIDEVEKRLVDVQIILASTNRIGNEEIFDSRLKRNFKRAKKQKLPNPNT